MYYKVQEDGIEIICHWFSPLNFLHVTKRNLDRTEIFNVFLYSHERASTAIIFQEECLDIR